MRLFLRTRLYKKIGISPGGTSDTANETADVQQTSNRDDSLVRCANCKQVVSSTCHRIEVAGRHQHHCVNPSGVLYRISCYRHASGCVPHGNRSDDYSWFANHSWQVDRCFSCGIHLGWNFSSIDSRFHGLITKQLIVR
jgi:hypothetical protein